MKQKLNAKIALLIYVLFLIWGLFLKFSISLSDIKDAFAIGNINRINFVPFSVTFMKEEVLLNIVIFIPFGILLYIVNNKLLKNMLFICVASALIEGLQYVFRLGICDATDIIMNFLGGIIGLVLMKFIKNISRSSKTENSIIFIIYFLMGLFIIFYLYVIFILKIKIRLI